MGATRKAAIKTKALQLAEENRWMWAHIPARIAQGMVDEELRKLVFQDGLAHADVPDNGANKFITGWALLAGSAKSVEERQQAYDIVMRGIDWENIAAASNVHIAAAILGNEEQRCKNYKLASDLHSLAVRAGKYGSIQAGTLLAMAISAAEGAERSYVYNLSRERIRIAGDSPTKDILTHSLAAQTIEERFISYKLAELYAEPRVG